MKRSGYLVAMFRRAWHLVRRAAESFVLLAMFMASMATWGFIELSKKVTRGSTEAFDTAVMLMMRNPADVSDPIGPKWFEELGRDFTALGGVGVLVLLTVFAGCFMWLKTLHRTALFLGVAIGGGLLASTAFKNFFDRPRPELVPHGSNVYTASFPSGHSMMAAITYLTLAALLARTQSSTAIRTFLILAATLIVIGVGISRVYLGVHWPTDVLAGWTAGAAWALGCLAVAHWLGRRRAIEPDHKAGLEPPVQDEDASPKQ
ncbi:phosphatase PAP2 family protein [Paracoccus indicus]|uniref:phosphatase PAP2 family protein n=1 Tax=Paracoccus indicus TaxID=2079229 RepID=UPI001FE6EA3A|nr:phosphatase PAP2 family protein [Paracoccus indicus]